MPSASSCLLHVFCFAEYPYQTKSKRNKNLRGFFWNIYDFWEEESTRGDARSAHKPCRRGQGVGPRQARLWPLLKAVGALLSPQERKYPEENRVKISAQSELRISRNLRNGESQNLGAQK